MLTDTSHSLAVFRTLVPLFNSLSTFLYSSFLASSLLTLPTLRPSLPPLAMKRSRPLLRRNLMFSCSISAQVPNQHIAEAWKTLSSGELDNTIRDFLEARIRMQLCDWDRHFCAILSLVSSSLISFVVV